MNETNTQRRRNRAKNTQRRRKRPQEYYILAPPPRKRLLSIRRVASRKRAKRTEFASRAANVIHFEIRFEVIHRQTVTSHRRFSVVVFIRVDGVGDVSVRVLEDFSYALRDVRIIIRLIKLLMLSEGIFEFVRHVVQNGTTLTLKDKRLREQSTTETILKASKKSASNKSLSVLSLFFLFCFCSSVFY
jgi:hypothetical protein